VAVAAVAFFAMWSVLSNLLCAVLIFTVGPFRIGDVVELVDTLDKPGVKGRHDRETTIGSIPPAPRRANDEGFRCERIGESGDTGQGDFLSAPTSSCPPGIYRDNIAPTRRLNRKTARTFPGEPPSPILDDRSAFDHAAIAPWRLKGVLTSAHDG